jgi:cold shock CspA family protein
MNKGTVKFFNAQKGWGFIQPDDGSKEALRCCVESVEFTTPKRTLRRDALKFNFENKKWRGPEAAPVRNASTMNH